MAGDTLKGVIKMNPKKVYENFSKISYCKKEGSDVKVFKPQKVSGYMVDSIKFDVKKIDDDLMFARRLSADTASQMVYEVQTQYESMNEIRYSSEYYFEKKNKELEAVKSKKAIKIIEEAKEKNKKINVSDLELKKEK